MDSPTPDLGPSRGAAPPAARDPRSGALLVDRELRELVGSAVREARGAAPIRPEQLQPASLDVRLGRVAHRIRAGFLPGPGGIDRRLAELEIAQLPLDGDGAVLERGCVYLVPLQEELELPHDLVATFNPRSSIGRCDVLTRVLAGSHPRFNEAPGGYRGRLWMEVAPLSWPVRLRRGDRLGQMRLARGRTTLDRDELLALYARAPLCHDADGPIPASRVRLDDEGALLLRLGLAGRSPAGWRARPYGGVVEFGRTAAHDVRDFWDPVEAPGGACVLAPGPFYLFASRERVVIPPGTAAEMLPVDVDIGEMRNNYAGFFDTGFGWSEDPAGRGATAVLEVRAHDVPFRVEEGQVFFRLRYHRTSGAPEALYGSGRPSYREQDLTHARCFRAAVEGSTANPAES